MIKRDLEFGKMWQNLLASIETSIGKKPADLNAVLFLIGVQELGRGNAVFSKEEKQDLIHLGICKALSLHGYYDLQGLDSEGWPHWVLCKNLPHLKVNEQERFLKGCVIEYFSSELGMKI